MVSFSMPPPGGALVGGGFGAGEVFLVRSRSMRVQKEAEESEAGFWYGLQSR